MNKTLRDHKEKSLIREPLRGLVEQLKDAHGDLPDEQIRDVAKNSLDRFAKARTRNFVPVLAWRHAQRNVQEQPSGRGTPRECREEESPWRTCEARGSRRPKRDWRRCRRCSIRPNVRLMPQTGLNEPPVRLPSTPGRSRDRDGRRGGGDSHSPDPHWRQAPPVTGRPRLRILTRSFRTPGAVLRR
jgi:hypothetical protein